MNFLPVRSMLSAVVVAALGVFSAAPLSAGPEAEPLYFVYHGQQKALTLDGQHVAVHVKTGTANPRLPAKLPAGLNARGFSDADVVARPVTDWIILDAQKALPVATAGTHLTVPSSQAESGAAIHAVIDSLLNSGDATIEFVSPVFRDGKGDPIVLTPTLLIGFEENVSAAAREGLQRSLPEGAQLQKVEFPQPHDQRWQIQSRDGFVVLARANALAERPGVAYAEPDMIVTGHPDLIPTDPSYSQSWGLNLMEAPSAWDITTGNASVIVLILDTGVQQDHPDINQVSGRDFTSNAAANPNGGPLGQYDNHGTWVAGCVSEKINNGIGSVGIAPGVKIASARCYNNVQSDGSFSVQFSWVIDALNWGQSIGARVSNNSNHYGLTSGALESAYASTRANGMVHFAAAGNDGIEVISYPSSISSVNSVGAARGMDTPSPFTQYGTGIKYLAPGEGIYTTDRTGAAGGSADDYIRVDGTSFASSYAAGVAALIISQHPEFDAAQVENQMQRSCKDMFSGFYDTYTGYGMVNALRALTIAPAAPLVSSPQPRLSLVQVFDVVAQRFAVDTRRPRVYATVPSSNSVIVIDTTSLSIVATVPVGSMPMGLAISSDGNKLWVANSGSISNGISAIDLNSLAVTGSFPTPVEPSSIVEGRDNRLYAGATRGWNGIMQFDARTGAYQSSFGSFSDKVFLATSPDRKKLYCGDENVTVFDISTASAAYVQSGGGEAFDLKVSRDGKFACASSGPNWQTQLLSGDNVQNVLQLFATGDFPKAVAFSNDASVLYQHRTLNGFSEIKTFDSHTSAMLDAVRLERRPPYSAMGYANDLVVDSSGKYLFASTYAIGVGTGELRIYATNRNDPLKFAQALNVSTRLRVETGDNVMIGGFIVTGSGNKRIIIRALGPSLSEAGISDFLADPVMELHDSTGALLTSNDNWQEMQQSEIQASGLAPQNDLESAIVASLQPGGYTAIVRGKDGGMGMGLVEVYDLNQGAASKLTNISTRGRVQTGDNVMIGGFILGGGNGDSRIVVRAIGPSLTSHGITDPLVDPVLELHDGNGALLSQNDDWQSDQQQEISNTGLAPGDTHESAILATLGPGGYTAIVRGKNSTTGVALVEVYNLSN